MASTGTTNPSKSSGAGSSRSPSSHTKVNNSTPQNAERPGFDALSEAMKRKSGKPGGKSDKKQKSASASGKRQESAVRLISRRIVENKYIVAFTTLLTVYALAGDDLRLMFTPASADFYFDVIVVICLVVFVIEVVLSCLGKDDYFLGFFFALDVISTSTLLLDLSPIQAWMQGQQNEDDEMGNLRAGRTARVGAKAGRIVRVLRLVRILKLYKAYYDAQKRKKRLEAEGKGPGEDEDEESDEEYEDDLEEGNASLGRPKKNDEESRVGKKLGEMTIRKVIILVLTMLLGLPFLKTGSEIVPTSAQYGAEHVWRLLEAVVDAPTYDQYADEMLDYIYYHNWYAGQGSGVMGEESNKDEVSKLADTAKIKADTVSKFEALHKHQDDIYNYGGLPEQARTVLSSKWQANCNTDKQVRYGISLLEVEVPEFNTHIVKCPQDLRFVESLSIRPRVLTEEQMLMRSLAFFFDLRPFVRLDAGYNLITTLFICFVLCVASLYFSSDANTLVLTPVENMIKRVEAIRADPLKAVEMADQEFKQEMHLKAQQSKRDRDTCFKFCKALLRCVTCRGVQASQGPMETVILEKTIIKLGSLLAVGFGEAGANIIGTNMRGIDTAGVNAMVPGRKVQCIIGIARIRDFAVCTEVLSSKIMTFVNQIAEIVHGVVDEYMGAPNKNTGESFVVIWQVDKYRGICDDSRLFEMTIMAFAKIIGSMHRSKVLAEYRRHPKLQQRLTKGGDYYVKLGFGLHCGYAIEGATGSEFKIDASYLSPNVSVAQSLEAATMVYGVPLLVAESVVEQCSSRMRKNCRLIDYVKITAAKSAMKLFCIDLNPLGLTIDAERVQTSWNSSARFKARQHLQAQKQNRMSEEFDVAALFSLDEDIRIMRSCYIDAFIQQFNMGFQNYFDGEWAVARRLLGPLAQIEKANPASLQWPDGPSLALLRFMEKLSFQSPKDWKGIRDLPVML